MSRAWFIEAVDGSKLWKGAKNKAMDSKDLPKSAKFMAWIPRISEEPSSILETLAAQNPTLKVEKSTQLFMWSRASKRLTVGNI